MNSSLNVETRKDSFHLKNTFTVGGPHSTEPSGVISVQVCRAYLEVGDIERLKQLAKVRIRVATSET